MKVLPIEYYHGEGTQVILTDGDSLEEVPESHREIITPEVRIAFKDPRGYFLEVANRAPLRSFGKWLEALTAGKWELVLADRHPMPWRQTDYGFRWSATHTYGMFRPGPHEAAEWSEHPEFRRLFSAFHEIGWAGLFESGGLFPPCELGEGPQERAPDFPPESTIIFGSTECGDMFVHNAAGRAGMLSYENGEGYVIGSIPETLDWIFGILMKGDSPQFEYDPKKR